jgi:cytochrome c oxidase subunit 2
VPVGKPVKLIMTSEDVIHSFFIPDFRVKQDVLPGRYSSLWFQATRRGAIISSALSFAGRRTPRWWARSS